MRAVSMTIGDEDIGQGRRDNLEFGVSGNFRGVTTARRRTGIGFGPAVQVKADGKIGELAEEHEKKREKERGNDGAGRRVLDSRSKGRTGADVSEDDVFHIVHRSGEFPVLVFAISYDYVIISNVRTIAGQRRSAASGPNGTVPVDSFDHSRRRRERKYQLARYA